MAYTQKSPKPDIRSLPLKSLEPKPAHSTSHAVEPTEQAIHHTKPSHELKRIAACSIPLILALAIASYYDTTHHWVIPAATWLFKLGS